MRRFYQKHTKNDRLDSVLLRLPLLHPDWLTVSTGTGQPTRCAALCVAAPSW